MSSGVDFDVALSIMHAIALNDYFSIRFSSKKQQYHVLIREADTFGVC